MPCGECLRPRVLSRARGSPSPPPKEPSAYWALPTPGSRWRSAGFNKLEDEDFGSGEGPSEHPGAGPSQDQASTPAGSAPSTPGSIKKQRSLKAAKPEKAMARGNSIRMMPNFQLPNFSAYSRSACLSPHNSSGQWSGLGGGQHVDLAHQYAKWFGHHQLNAAAPPPPPLFP